LGRQEVHVFSEAPQHHYLARLIERPDQTTLPPNLRLLQARGPFDRAAEERLLREERIEVVVSKNAGGAATYAKIEAARALGLPVVMIARPHKPAGIVMADVEACVAWLHGLAPRGVEIQRPTCRVVLAPTITSVRMSACVASTSASVVAITFASPLPAARTSRTGVSVAFTVRSIANASPSW